MLVDPIDAFNRARAMDALGRRAAALGVLRDGLAAHPGHPALAGLYSNIMMQLGDADAAWPELDRLVRGAGAGVPEFWSSLASAANAGAGADPRRVLEFHRGYGRALEAARPAAVEMPRRTMASGEPLRVGIVSYDYKRHSSVSFFLRPLLEHLDRERFEVTAYHVGRPVDDLTEHFRGLVHRFRHMPEPAPDDLAAAIRGDGIDLALELIGHTGRRAMPAFQPRCAPVQVSYLGYSNTTGMRSFDWRIVDSVTDPPGAEALATEKLYRLDPCFLCFAPDPETPEVAPPPCLARGHVTFGSFNSVLKLSAPTLRLWGRVLDSVPGSRLILKNRAPHVSGGVEHLRARLLAAGVDLSRVEIRPMTPAYREHLESYAEVDIALDTFPYNGTTTTCESLLMGVPVLTLRPAPEHDRHAARVGMSLLAASGNAHLIASDGDDLVRKSVALAAEAAHQRRDQLRERFLLSPVCDASRFGERFGAALSRMVGPR